MILKAGRIKTIQPLALSLENCKAANTIIHIKKPMLRKDTFDHTSHISKRSLAHFSMAGTESPVPFSPNPSPAWPGQLWSSPGFTSDVWRKSLTVVSEDVDGGGIFALYTLEKGMSVP